MFAFYDGGGAHRGEQEPRPAQRILMQVLLHDRCDCNVSVFFDVHFYIGYCESLFYSEHSKRFSKTVALFFHASKQDTQ